MTGDEPDTQELLGLARQGRDDALAELFRRYREQLRRALALRMDDRLASRVDVSDILQETYLEVSRRLPDYLAKQGLPFYLWLRWIAGEQLLMSRRRHTADKRDIRRECVPLPVASSSQFVRGLLGREVAPSKAAAASELAELLQSALRQLDEDESEIILMRHFEQMSNNEIAQILGISDAAANKRYIRALQRLRGLLLNLGVYG